MTVETFQTCQYGAQMRIPRSTSVPTDTDANVRRLLTTLERMHSVSVTRRMMTCSGLFSVGSKVLSSSEATQTGITDLALESRSLAKGDRGMESSSFKHLHTAREYSGSSPGVAGILSSARVG